ncbi:hypothetical protein HOY80DRAFT_1068888 [Tuber brumale]|nr:hypothetical protein HOY80DRAFT_1068888 [Tuber brumale]
MCRVLDGATTTRMVHITPSRKFMITLKNDLELGSTNFSTGLLLVPFLAVLLTVSLILGYKAHVLPKERVVISPPSIPFVTPIPDPKPAGEIFFLLLSTVGFHKSTLYWPILQQSVVSYITAGWPPVNIYVVDNTGTMDSNELGLSTLQNPFFIDYLRLRTLGVNIITALTLLTFAHHMDSAMLSHEEQQPYRSLYQRIIENRNSMNETEKWAIKFFFAYGHLALVNVAAYKDVGGWDTQIPFYIPDCHLHARLHMMNYTTTDENVGHIFDVRGTVPDLSVSYPWTPRIRNLHKLLADIQRSMNEAKYGRNIWQSEQRGGKGKPFYRNPVGFEEAMRHWIKTGRTVFAERWGHRNCDIWVIRKEIDKPWEYKKDWWI